MQNNNYRLEEMINTVPRTLTKVCDLRDPNKLNIDLS